MSGPLDTIPPDQGCDLAPRCLECPFPKCRYDGEGVKAARFRLKGEEAARLRDVEGYSIAQIAGQTGCTKRTVFRRLAIVGRGEPSRGRGRPLATHRRD